MQRWPVDHNFLRQTMISMPYVKASTEEAVLDLCVRKSSPQRLPYSPPRSPPGYLDLCKRDVEMPENGYSATVTVLQNRLYEDRYTSSYGSEGESSTGPISPVASNGFRVTSPVSPSSTNRFIGITNPLAPIPAITRSGKPTRPFKAYPKDPLTFVAPAADCLNSDSNEAYAEFRRRMLEQVRDVSGNGGNKNMKRPVQSLSPSSQQPSSSMDSKDSAYWERRRKNNASAKRSRDARRAKEDEIAIRAAFLEQENVKLKYELAALRNETNRLRCMLYSN